MSPSEVFFVSRHFVTIYDLFIRFASPLGQDGSPEPPWTPIIIHELVDDDRLRFRRLPLKTSDSRAEKRRSRLLFYGLKAPFSRISTYVLAPCIVLTLKDAWIVAPPGFTRHMSVSDAFPGL